MLRRTSSGLDEVVDPCHGAVALTVAWESRRNWWQPTSMPARRCCARRKLDKRATPSATASLAPGTTRVTTAQRRECSASVRRAQEPRVSLPLRDQRPGRTSDVPCSSPPSPVGSADRRMATMPRRLLHLPTLTSLRDEITALRASRPIRVFPSQSSRRTPKVDRLGHTRHVER